MTDEETRAQAILYAKQNKLRIARLRTDPHIYAPTREPISVFMAGSPGAGKTEFSRDLVTILESEGDQRVVRIDADDIRNDLPGYFGGNAHLFQGAASLIVEKMHDLALHRSQHFILDGTFTNSEKAKENIDRSLSRQRKVWVVYVYQKPDVAWEFTQAREKIEGRKIPRELFAEQFLNARLTVAKVHEAYGTQVTIFIVKKDFQNNAIERIAQLDQNTSIDSLLGHVYTKDEIEKKL